MQTQVLKLDKIKVAPDRQRSKPSDQHIADLAESISQIGLIHALVVDQDFNLVAGFCRYSALQRLDDEVLYGEGSVPPGYAPVVVTSSTSPATLFQIELEENLRRENLSPLDRARAIAKFHEMRSQRALSAFPPKPTPTVKDTGAEIAALAGEQPATKHEVEVSNSILVNSFADDPEVQEAAKRSLSYAAKVAKRKLDADLSSMLFEAEKQELDDSISLIHGDALQVLETLEPKSFDGMIFDPPYGMSAHEFGTAANLAGHNYMDTPEYADQFISAVLVSCSLLMRDQAHIYMFCDISRFEHYRQLAEKFLPDSALIWRTPLIWFKGTTGHSPHPDLGPKRSYEAILYANLGKKKVTSSQVDVLSFPAVKDKLHAAEKPVELLSHLCSLSFLPGQRVLDPCAGSGPILLAAKKHSLRVTAIEQSEEHFKTARKRVY